MVSEIGAVKKEMIELDVRGCVDLIPDGFVFHILHFKSFWPKLSKFAGVIMI